MSNYMIIFSYQVLSDTHSFKTVKKASECLRMIALGLIENKFISTDSLLMFLYGVMSQSIPDLTKENTKKRKPAKQLPFEKANSLLLVKEPGRAGVIPKTSKKTNAHILIEFGLLLYHTLLKREKVQLGNEKYLQMMDPIVPMFAEFLNSQHIKVMKLL